MTIRRLHLGRALTVTAALAAGGCNVVLGLSAFEDATATGSGGSAASTSATAAGGTSAAGGAGGEGGGGEGGSGEGGSGEGGSGEGGIAQFCAPGETQACAYSGPPGTEGVGVCLSGEQTCNRDGLAYGPCTGTVVPSTEVCDGTLADEDCDGEANESGAGCLCMPGAPESCYTGPPGTSGVGVCASGLRTCGADGITYEACAGDTLPASETCVDPADEDCDGYDCASWAAIHGDASSQFGASLAVDASGNTVVAGYFFGSLKIGAQTLVGSVNSEIFVAKLGPTGTPLWAKQFGDANSQRPYGVAVDGAGSIVLAGYDAGSTDFGGGGKGPGIFVTKLDTNGAHLWSRGLGGANPSATGSNGTSIAFDAAGDVIVTGSFQSSITPGPGTLSAAGSTDAFLSKLGGASGAGIWSKAFGDGGAQGAQDVAIDDAGNILLIVTLAGSADFGGGALMSAGSNDLVLAKFDTNGTHSWSKRYGDASSQVGSGLAVDAQGNPILTGYFAGSLDFGGGGLASAGANDIFVAKISNVGTHLWSKHFGDGVGQDGQSVAVDDAGDVFLFGNFSGTVDLGGGALTSAGQRDLFLARLTSQGAHVWSKAYGGAGDETAGDLAALPLDAGLVLTGGAQGTIDLGRGPLVTAGGNDVLLARLGL